MEKHPYHVSYITFKKELYSFNVEARDWEELLTRITEKLPENADYICNISYNKKIDDYDI